MIIGHTAKIIMQYDRSLRIRYVQCFSKSKMLHLATSHTHSHAHVFAAAWMAYCNNRQPFGVE